MRGGVILIVVALLVGYLGVSGRYKCFTAFAKCISGMGGDCDCKGTPTNAPIQENSSFQMNRVEPLKPIQGILA